MSNQLQGGSCILNAHLLADCGVALWKEDVVEGTKWNPLNTKKDLKMVESYVMVVMRSED